MNEFITVFGSIVVAFLLGSVTWLFLLRGFVTKWLAARRGGRVLLLVLRKAGLPVFRVARFRPLDKDNDIKTGGSGFWEYALDGKTDRHAVVFDPGCTIRFIRVNFGIVFEGDTAAVNFRKAVYQKRKLLARTEQGEEVEVESVEPVAWEAWDDSANIVTLGMRSSQVPKIPSTGFNMGLIAIIGIVALLALGGFYLVNQLNADEPAPAPAAPVVVAPGVVNGSAVVAVNPGIINGSAVVP